MRSQPWAGWRPLIWQREIQGENRCEMLWTKRKVVRNDVREVGRILISRDSVVVHDNEFGFYPLATGHHGWSLSKEVVRLSLCLDKVTLAAVGRLCWRANKHGCRERRLESEQRSHKRWWWFGDKEKLSDSTENTEKGPIRIVARLGMEYERKGNNDDPQVSKYE